LTARVDALGLKGGLIVSCQAAREAPLHGPVFMAAMARAAQMAGAVGIRADGPMDIAAIKGEVGLPMLGIYKIRLPSQHPRAYITPTFESAAETVPGPPTALSRELVRAVPIPVIGEGSFKTPEECAQAIEAGAHAVVVGTALTAPEKVMAEFVEAMAKAR